MDELGEEEGLSLLQKIDNNQFSTSSRNGSDEDEFEIDSIAVENKKILQRVTYISIRIKLFSVENFQPDYFLVTCRSMRRNAILRKTR